MRGRISKRYVKKQKRIIFFSVILSLFILSIGYSAFQTIISINTAGHIKFDERCVVGNVFNFEQKDEIQEFKVPCSGTYKLETWGASGGNTISNNNLIGKGGLGGYSEGKILIKIKQKIYIAVGGKGDDSIGGKGNSSSSTSSLVSAGGYNGGGNAGHNANDTSFAYGSGGGATHIALSTGLLSTLENNQSNLLIVAGAGGGAGYVNGGSGGGTQGNNVEGGGTQKQAIGGSQIIGGTGGFDSFPTGSFGLGANGGQTNPGGGSGYYGGGFNFRAGAGGSGYIGNISLKDKSMYCYDCEESLDLTKPEIFTVSTTGSSNYKDTINCPNGYSETPISKCAKKGDGYARITLVSRK